MGEEKEGCNGKGCGGCCKDKEDDECECDKDEEVDVED